MRRIHVPLFEKSRQIDRSYNRRDIERILAQVIASTASTVKIPKYARFVQRSVLTRNAVRYKCDIAVDLKTYSKLVEIKQCIRHDSGINVKPRLDNIVQSIIAVEITSSCEVSEEKVLCRGIINESYFSEFISMKSPDVVEKNKDEIAASKYFEKLRNEAGRPVPVNAVGLQPNPNRTPEFNELSRKVYSWVSKNQRAGAGKAHGTRSKLLAPDLQAFLLM